MSATLQKPTCFNVNPPGQSALDVSINVAVRFFMGLGAIALDDQESHFTYSKKPTILIVEDDQGFREFLGNGLSKEYEILEAAHGFEGYRLFRQHTPDLVITDLVMPFYGGDEMIKKLATPKQTTPIIVISGFDAPSLLSFANYVEDALLFLPKPFFVDELLEACRQKLSKFQTHSKP